MLSSRSLGLVLLLFCLLLAPSFARTSRPDDHFDRSLLVELPDSEADVLKAVQEVTEDQIVHGTYSYEKERILYGAHSSDSSAVFGAWQEGGRVFYKVAEKVLAPKFFKETGDIGTITVRYVVQSISATSTSLRIDAVFFDARHVKHESQGNVESSEYAAIQEHLRALQEQQKANEQAAQENAAKRAQLEREKQSRAAAGDSGTAGLGVRELRDKVEELRRQVVVRVKQADTALKSAPFHSASTIQSLPADAEVLVVILTPYWYGVETEDGHRGWIHRNEVEPLP